MFVILKRSTKCFVIFTVYKVCSLIMWHIIKPTTQFKFTTALAAKIQSMRFTCVWSQNAHLLKFTMSMFTNQFELPRKVINQQYIIFHQTP